jgi:undecaprenyl-diphosphatase
MAGMAIDVSLFRFLNGLSDGGGLFDAFVIFCARFLPYLVILVVAWHLWLKRREVGDLVEKGFQIFAPAVASCFVLGIILKELVARPRPFMSLPGVNLLVGVDGYAFPSAHAAFFFSLGLTVFFWDQTFGKRLILAAVVIGIARVVAGMHYPLDILGGAAIGLLVSYIMNIWRLRFSR